MAKFTALAPIFSLFFSLSLVACSPHDDDDTPRPQEPVSKVQAKPDSCDILKTRLNSASANTKAMTQEVFIERHLQRVIRKDCQGKITSDEIETVKAPTYNLTLKAPEKKKFRSVFVFNQNSCDHKLTSMPILNVPLVGLLYAVTGDGEQKIMIKGDIAPAVFTFKLEKDLNQIFVQYFYDCSPETVDGNAHAIIGHRDCINSLDSEIVEYPVKATYLIKNLEGAIEVLPSAESCKPVQSTSGK